MDETEASSRRFAPPSAQSAGPNDSSAKALSSPNSRRGIYLVGGLVVFGAFVIGILLGSGVDVGAKLLRGLAILGEPQYTAYQEAYAEPAGGRLDYLVFIEEGQTEVADRYFSENPALQVVDQTIFAQGIVVSVPSPNRPWVESLKAQAFTWLVVRDRPFFFCH